MKNFHSFGLSGDLVKSLDSLGFVHPTPIQLEAIPVALTGKDILGSAQTGTGKTVAFSVPLVEKIMSTGDDVALVITPTRELASQVMKAIRDLLGSRLARKSALLIGGESMSLQLRALAGVPRVIVGTPGRIKDHLNRGTLKLSKVSFLVLDETDRMLDMGFSEDIEEIISNTPKHRQTVLFSATLPKNILTIAGKYLNDPVRIAIEENKIPVDKIKQDLVFLSEKEKYSNLTEQLSTRTGSIIIFVKTKMGAERITRDLRRDDHAADTIHGDLRHHKREQVIKAFRNKQYRIMVATDIASRGLDIPHIEHVINYDLPQCPEDYIHRIGRTGRAGNSGEALCFITPSDQSKWRAISYLIDPNAKGSEPEQRNRGRKRPDRRSVKRNAGTSDFRSGERKPFRSREDKPSFRSREDKPSFRSGEGKPFRSREDKPFRSGEGKPSFRSGEGKPSFRSSEGKPSFRSGTDKPFRSREDKPSFRSSEGKPAFRAKSSGPKKFNKSGSQVA